MYKSVYFTRLHTFKLMTKQCQYSLILKKNVKKIKLTDCVYRQYCEFSSIKMQRTLISTFSARTAGSCAVLKEAKSATMNMFRKFLFSF